MLRVTLIAGRLGLPAVMKYLSNKRTVFHSEADFQFGFAQAVTDLDSTVRVRLEVPKRAERRTYVDLTCAADQTSLIEFKYVTRAWAGPDVRTDEHFDLRGHEALDLARLHFIHDVTRIEGWTQERADMNGFAVLLTNDNRLWEQPRTLQPTRDHAFRLHHGQTLTGNLHWGTAERPYPANRRDLRGTYTADWNDYHRLDDRPGGELRWLGWHITG